MWQSHVEIEGYSVVYLHCITVFEDSIAEPALRAGLVCAS